MSKKNARSTKPVPGEVSERRAGTECPACATAAAKRKAYRRVRNLRPEVREKQKAYRAKRNALKRAAASPAERPSAGSPDVGASLTLLNLPPSSEAKA